MKVEVQPARLLCGIVLFAGLIWFCIPTTPPVTASEPSSIVTNWISPGPNHRLVNQQLYDVNASSKWISLTLPSIHYHFEAPVPAPGQRAALKGYGGNLHISILNFPYNPRDFGTAPGNSSEMVPARSLQLRVLPVSALTNWATGGKIVSIQRTYDFGLPATNKIPVLVRKS